MAIRIFNRANSLHAEPYKNYKSFGTGIESAIQNVYEGFLEGEEVSRDISEEDLKTPIGKVWKYLMEFHDNYPKSSSKTYRAGDDYDDKETHHEGSSNFHATNPSSSNDDTDGREIEAAATAIRIFRRVHLSMEESYKEGEGFEVAMQTEYERFRKGTLPRDAYLGRSWQEYPWGKVWKYLMEFHDNYPKSPQTDPDQEEE